MWKTILFIRVKNDFSNAMLKTYYQNVLHLINFEWSFFQSKNITFHGNLTGSQLQLNRLWCIWWTPEGSGQAVAKVIRVSELPRRTVRTDNLSQDTLALPVHWTNPLKQHLRIASKLAWHRPVSWHRPKIVSTNVLHFANTTYALV